MISGSIGDVPFDGNEQARVDYIDRFRDEFGNRRASDRAFLSHLLGVRGEQSREPDAMMLDERLWWALARHEHIAPSMLADRGGLLADLDALAIEYRTMVELCSLQAAWAIALRDRNKPLRRRVLEAAMWHIDELQPDNAINRPWGLPVFVELSNSSEDQLIAQTSELHAQTLLHNACINFGTPDLLSTLILKDAIELLRTADQSTDFCG